MAQKRKAETPKVLRQIIFESRKTQTRLAEIVGTSPAYFNHLATGYRTPSPQLIETMAVALNLSPVQTVQLHQAAARDHGFKIDLKEDT